MKGIVTISLVSVFTIAFAQYPHSRAPEAPPQHGYSSGPSHRSTNYAAPQIEVPTPQAPLVPPQTPHRSVHQAAPVHYVNIGPQLQGDYKFGYDTGKGDDGQSFREETRLADGTVQGSYGYVDASGKQRIVKYTAGKQGFKVEGDENSADTPKTSVPAAYAPPARAAARQTQNLHQSYPPQPIQPDVYAPDYAPPPYQQRPRTAASSYPVEDQNLQPRYPPQPIQPEVYVPDYAPPTYQQRPRTAASSYPVEDQNLQPRYPPQPIQPEVYAPGYSPPTYQPRSRTATSEYPEQESYSVPLLQTWDKRPEYDVQSVRLQYQDVPATRGARRGGAIYRDADNEISEDDNVPVPFDTSLFSYNIGASQ